MDLAECVGRRAICQNRCGNATRGAVGWAGKLDLNWTSCFGCCRADLGRGKEKRIGQREKFHSNRLGDAISLYNPETQQRVDTLTQLFVSKGTDFNTAQSQAFQAIASTVSRESYVMAFNDCFYFIGFALLLSGVAVLFFKKVRVSDAASGGH